MPVGAVDLTTMPIPVPAQEAIETSEGICERCGEYGGMKHFFCFTSCRTKGRRKVKMGKIVILANDRRC